MVQEKQWKKILRQESRSDKTKEGIEKAKKALPSLTKKKREEIQKRWDKALEDLAEAASTSSTIDFEQALTSKFKPRDRDMMNDVLRHDVTSNINDKFNEFKRVSREIGREFAGEGTRQRTESKPMRISKELIDQLKFLKEHPGSTTRDFAKDKQRKNPEKKVLRRYTSIPGGWERYEFTGESDANHTFKRAEDRGLIKSRVDTQHRTRRTLTNEGRAVLRKYEKTHRIST
jgi:hypothetical protein